MAITFPLSLPSTKFVGSTVRMVDAVAVTRAPFTFREESQNYDGDRVEATIEVARMSVAEARLWRSFLANLGGIRGSFLLGDDLGDAPSGAALSSPGTPTVNGAHAVAARELSVTGGPLSTPGWLLAGDFLQLGSGSTARLHMVTVDAATDGAGDTTLDVYPSIRTALSGGEAITLTAPKGLFRLASNIREIDIQRARHVGLTLDAVEDLR